MSGLEKRMRIVTAGALILGGCSTASPPPPSSWTPDMSDPSSIWQACVRSAFPEIARTMPDNNAAMEAAFAACKTEEDAMLAVVRNETGTESAPLRVVIRDLMKRDLLGS